MMIDKRTKVGIEFETKLNDYVKDVNGITVMDFSTLAKAPKDIPFFAADPDHVRKDFLTFTFENTPVIAALASVTQMANLPQRLIRYRHYLGQVSKRHATEQQVGAAIAYEAWRRRDAGLPDPTEHLTQQPPIDQLDAFFGEPGVAKRVREAVTRGILHSPVALRDEGFDIMLHNVRDGGSRAGLWRTVARLAKLGEPARALRLITALATS
jgi:hypothetical protein